MTQALLAIYVFHPSQLRPVVWCHVKMQTLSNDHCC